MKPRDDYRITAVRLVEFHNLGTTTVELPEGGHLFLLGDNGSGKTTLLDAVHLVLTAGREMELNSAARVVGAKDAGGRTMQGIVLRYNAATGRPARETGITYAALELRTPSDKVLSFVVGLSAEGMDVAFERWGGLAAVPVVELPLAISEGDRLRTATQAEFKRDLASLPGGRYFAHGSDYREAVANRVFGGEAKYADVCRLLRTGKAYREIAARASNYDDLFRQLLEDPNRETFEPLLKGLRELDASEAKFADLDARADYLSALQSESAKLDRLRLELQLVSWFEATAGQVRAQAEMEQLAAAILAGESEIASLEQASAETQEEMHHVRERLNALRAQDATGLLGREKELVVRVADAERRAVDAAAAEAAEKKVRATREKARRMACVARGEILARAADEILRLAKGSSVAVGTLTDALRTAQHPTAADDAAAFGERFSEIRRNIAAVRDEAARRAVSAEALVSSARAAEDAARTVLAQIRQAGESLPEVEGFPQARREMREALLSARPVYELLEPAATADAKQLALLERLAGEEFLGTWLTDAAETDAVRRILYKTASPLTLAVRGEIAVDERTTAWLRRYLNYEESDPEAVKLLALQLSAVGCPTEADFLGRATWSFRAREGLMPFVRPRLLGLKAREAEQARREREAEAALAAVEKQVKQAERAAAAEAAAVQVVRALEDAVESARQTAASAAEKVRRAVADYQTSDSRYQLLKVAADEKRCQAERVRAELEDVRVRMRSEGIDASLDRRIQAAERTCAAAEARKADLDRTIGAVRGRVEGLQAQRQRRQAEGASFAATVATVEAQLAARVPSGTVFADFARATCPFADAAEFASIRERLGGDIRVTANNIEHRVRDPRGEAYSFVFDAVQNRLTDRRGTELAAVLADERHRLEELRGAINRKSREVFERIFMGEVMQRLYIDLMRLEDLVGRVQRQLSGRRFGSSRYAFSLQPVPEYEGFVRLVRRGYQMDAEGGKDELKDYLEQRKDEILHADIDAIPDIFDYRKWFRFVLKVAVENEEGLVIDRRVKSMGSGGEQAVPNYLLILTVAEFLYHGGTETDRPRCAPLLFDEAFYGIDAARRDQLLAFADDLGLQLFVSSPDQDGVKREIRHSVSLIVVKDENLDVHLSPVLWCNAATQTSLFDSPDRQQVGMVVMDETT